MTWAAVIAAGVGCYLLKLAGLAVPGRVLDDPVVARVADLIPVALLAALVAVQVLADSDGHLVLDARVVALGRGGRAPGAAGAVPGGRLRRGPGSGPRPARLSRRRPGRSRPRRTRGARRGRRTGGTNGSGRLDHTQDRHHVGR